MCVREREGERGGREGERETLRIIGSRQASCVRVRAQEGKGGGIICSCTVLGFNTPHTRFTSRSFAAGVFIRSFGTSAPSKGDCA